MGPDRSEFIPEQKQYSVVKMDEWKPPQDDDLMCKVAEIDSLDEGPVTAAGRGESILIIDADGQTVSATEGPESVTGQVVRERVRED